MIQVNITSLTHLTKLFLKKMIESKSGKIMNVSSGAGFVSGPLVSVYSATKSYVLHFSEALANEVHGTGVSITCLCPDATRTNIWERANAEDSRACRGRMMDAATCAKLGYTALKKGKVFGLVGRVRITPFMLRIIPRGIPIKAARRQFERA